jgi:ankyrin repeat protein
MWINSFFRGTNNTNISLLITDLVKAIDNNDIKKAIKIIGKNEDKDTIFEMYNQKLLNYQRLNFIVSNNILQIPIQLIKVLMKNNGIMLLDIIFSRYYLYDNEFILNLLIYYKNKSPLNYFDLKKQMLKYKISIGGFYDNCGTNVRYLINPCMDGRLYVVKQLLKFGANINGESRFNWSPLHIASKYGHIDIVKYLVEHGANINKKTENGCTPLYIASEEGYEAIVKFLIEHGASVNKSDFIFRKTPLDIACEKGYETIVKMLIEHDPDVKKYENALLLVACERGYEKIVKILIEHGANINIRDDNVDSLLHIACRNGHEAVVKMLVEQKADIHKKGSKGTPLHDACENGNEAIVKYLIEKGADINVKNNENKTPIKVAYEYGNDHIVNYLNEIDADKKRRNTNDKLSYGKTSKNKIENILIENEIDLLNSDRLVDACKSENKNIIKYLIKQGANVNHKDANNDTPLTVACNNEKIIKYLVEHGADIHKKGRYNKTPLHTACECGNETAVHYLVEHGAVINIKDDHGDTPMLLAYLNGYENIVNYLKIKKIKSLTKSHLINSVY